MAKFNPSDHLMNLKGKDYLPVAMRLVWLREEHPDATIVTEHIAIEDNRAVFRATITIPNGGASTGYGSETQKDFGDFLEKAETKAIGRALAALGYGTQFAPELDEGERIVDTPQQRTNAPQRGNQAPAKVTPITAKPAGAEAIKRIHAILADHDLEHRHLHAYAVMHVGRKSSKELTTDELKKLADGLKEKPEASVGYLTKLANDLELAEANAAVNAQVDGKGK